MSCCDKPGLLPVEEALARLMALAAQAPIAEVEQVPLGEAEGRVLAEPLLFRDGRTFSRFEAVSLPGRKRGGLVYRSELGGLYRIPKLKDRVYLIERKAGRSHA